MNIIATDLKDVYILEPRVFGDHRGWFLESWSERTMQEKGLYYNFIQDNHSYSSLKGTLRGLHCQHGEAAQAKLVRCTRGAVMDFVVDIRKGSPTYKQWIAVELSADNFRQLLIPKGFLHGFLTLTDDVEFLYKADNFYDKEEDRTIIWNDPELGVVWGIDDPIVSEKDSEAPGYLESDLNFIYQEIGHNLKNNNQ
ncbi:MAG: dTDP-4-dehydrorhamnose 3,5-epimerase [Herbinix sp.]|jgi:dTDP-4-dehydrorhamnose 3,5-epimerase|nr:dTDP-4-dehydrorhamnose 3,5-epimerase [Herbinix sp.]